MQQLNIIFEDILLVLNIRLRAMYNKALFFLKRKFLPRRVLYPLEIKKIIQKTFNKNFAWHPQTLKLDLSKLSGRKDYLQLAGTKIKIDNCHKLSELKFSDNEDSLSFHRWAWLIKNFDNNRQELIDIIESWVDDNLDKQKENIWDAYSCAERICNGVIFYNLENRQPSKRMIQAFNSFAENIINNLEYYSQFTNNHILNDARGLFFAGCYLDNKYYKRLAETIIKRELPIHITGEGFLREGSSHYHFLITKWITEIFWLASAENNELAVFIKPWLKKLNRVCNFFLVFNRQTKQYEIPPFGDFSPDFNPEWLVNYHLINHVNGDLNNYKKNNEESGWHRFDFQDFVLFVKAVTKSNSHSHNDIGTFVLYIDGKPFLVDRGRINYLDDIESNYGLSIFAHNSISIDNSDCLHKKTNYFLPEISWQHEKDRINIKIKLTAIKKLQKIILTRTFILKKGIFEIEDHLEGKQPRVIETRFHFVPDIKIKQNGDNYILSGLFGKTEFICSQAIGGEIIDAWHYPEYGKRVISNTLSCRGEIRLPTKIKYQFILR